MNLLGNAPSRQRRDFYLSEVSERVLAEFKEDLKRDSFLSLEVIINDALYQEQDRLKREKSTVENEDARRFWSDIGRNFLNGDDAEREILLRRIITRYVEEIHGSFNPRLHGMVARVVPWLLKGVLNKVSPASVLTWASDKLSLEDNLVISGPLDEIRSLAGKGTLIMAPTHSSNLDSVAIGMGLYLSRLPPFTYGAGLNLYTNPVISYFLNNLGAYKVDRRKKNEIYKTTLKQYATLSMEQGEHNLFFPGGTRNRRGDIEQHLKLGLLGCGVRVYVRNLVNANPKPDLFVVPVNLSYGLVLEAKTLIEDYLKEEGKGRFIRAREKKGSLMRMLDFWRNLTRMHSKVHLHFGEPIDLFGNRVDAEGNSRDNRHRVIDRKKYVLENGRPAHVPQRDQEYTRELGRSLVQAYLRNNIILSTHALSFAAFHLIRKRNPAFDLYRLLRTEGPETGIEKATVLLSLGRLKSGLIALADLGRLQIDSTLKEGDAETLFTTAMAHFSTFHDGRTLKCERGKVYSEDMKLLYYYRNHLDHYPLERYLEP